MLINALGCNKYSRQLKDNSIYRYAHVISNNINANGFVVILIYMENIIF